MLKLTVVGKRPAFLMSPSRRSVFAASPLRAHAARARLKLSRSGWWLLVRSVVNHGLSQQCSEPAWGAAKSAWVGFGVGSRDVC